MVGARGDGCHGSQRSNLHDIHHLAKPQQTSSQTLQLKILGVPLQDRGSEL
jgi:hypothetical protein